MSKEPPYNQPQQPQQPQQAQPYGGQPVPPASPAPQFPQTQQQSGSEPGKGLSIAAIILAFLVPIVGLILGIVALVQAKKAGRKNGLAVASIIIAAVLIVIGIIVAIVTIASLAAVGGNAMEAVEACLAGASSVEVLGQTLSCEEVLANY